MKAYKLEILVIDHENCGAVEIQRLIERAKYINPQVLYIKDADIGEWHDDHPLNKIEGFENAVKEYFKE